MKSWVTNILAVQQCDRQLRELEAKYRAIPVERAKLKTESAAAEAALAAARDTVNQIDRAIKQTEGEIEEFNTKIRKTLTQSAMIKKNAEYQAMMSEIGFMKHAVSDLETKVIELLDQQETAKKALAGQEKDFAATEREIRSELAEFAALVTSIKADALKLKAEKKRLALRGERKVLAAYQNILTHSKGLPVVPVVNGACANCSLKVTPQIAHETKKGVMVFCDNCFHLLYDPDCTD